MYNFTYRFYLDTRYKSKKNAGKYPVKIRIQSKVTSEYKNFKTGFYMSELKFYSLYPEYAPKDFKKKQTYIDKSGQIARDEENKTLKLELDSKLQEYKNGSTPDIVTINDLTHNLGYDNQSISLKDWYNNKAKQVESDGGLGQYKASFMSLTAYHNRFETARKFSIHLKMNLPYKELTVYDITVDFLNNWEKWMLKQNLSLDSVTGYASNLRAVLNLAKASKLISDKSYPFGDGKYILKENHQKINKYLYDVDKEKFSNYKPENEDEQLAKDLWFFSYKSNGVNLVEITNMKHSQLDSQKTSWWYYRSKNKKRKVQVKAEIPIDDSMREIIERYSGSVKYVFNFLDYTTTRKLNRKISDIYNDIAKKLKIDSLCFQMARHSAFTTLDQHFTIDEILDLGTHQKKTTLEGYIKKINLAEKQKKLYAKLQNN